MLILVVTQLLKFWCRFLIDVQVAGAGLLMAMAKAFSPLINVSHAITQAFVGCWFKKP